MSGSSIDPISDGPIARIKPPQLVDTGTKAEWEGLLDDEWEKIKKLKDSGKAFMQLVSVFSIIINYAQTYQMGKAANQLSFKNFCSQVVNGEREDFDQYSGGVDSPPSKDYVQDAKYGRDMLHQYMSDPKYKEYAGALGGDFLNQIDGMFSAPEGESVATWWGKMWTVPDPSEASSKTIYQGTSPVSNRINAALSDTQSQSSILNSQLDTDSKNLQKYLAFMQKIFQSLVGTTKVAVSAQKGV